MQPIGAKEDCPILPLTPRDVMSLDKPRQSAICLSLSREIACSAVFGGITRACVVDQRGQGPVSRADALAVHERGAASRLPEANLETTERNRALRE